MDQILKTDGFGQKERSAAVQAAFGHAIFDGDEAVGIAPQRRVNGSLPAPHVSMNNRQILLFHRAAFPDAPQIFLDDSGLAEAWRGSDRVFVFAPADKVEKVRAVIGDVQPIMHLGEKVVFANRAL